AGKADVVGDGAGEQERILGNQAHLLAKGSHLDVADVDVVNSYAAAPNVVEASQETGDRGFACTGRPDQGKGLAGLGDEAHVLQHGDALDVAEVDVVELDPSLDERHVVGARPVGNVDRRVQELKDLLAGGHRLLEEGVDLTQLA